MAFRRYANSRSRYGSSRFRSRGRGLREAKRPVRWQMANFNLRSQLEANGASQSTLSVTPIALIKEHLFGGTNTAGIRNSDQLVRQLEIGGIVYHAQVLWTALSDGDPILLDHQALAQILLVTDRLDEVGIPIALQSNWGTNTQPITLASAAEAQDEDVTFPLRVLQRHGVVYSPAVDNFPSGPTDPQYVANTPTVHSQWRKSIRLRLRLDDATCLAWHFHLSTESDYPGDQVGIVADYRVFGSLYYRLRL